jgi:hypothetical protein
MFQIDPTGAVLTFLDSVKFDAEDVWRSVRWTRGGANAGDGNYRRLIFNLARQKSTEFVN